MIFNYFASCTITLAFYFIMGDTSCKLRQQIIFFLHSLNSFRKESYCQSFFFYILFSAANQIVSTFFFLVYIRMLTSQENISNNGQNLEVWRQITNL